MAGIEDLIANITVAPLGQMVNQGRLDGLQVESAELQNLQRKLQYTESVKQAAVDALIRKRDTGTLNYEIEEQPRRQQEQTGRERMQYDAEVAESEVRQLKGAMKSEAEYNKFLLNRLTSGLPISDELLGEDGKPMAWKDVKAERLPGLYRKAIDSVGHLRNMEEEETRAKATAGSIPTSGVAATSGTQLNAGIKELENFLQETGFDLGSKADPSSDASWLGVQFAEIPNTVMRHMASKSGGGKSIAESTVRSKLRELAKKHTKTVGAWDPTKDDEALDKDAFLRDVEKLYNLESGQLGALGSINEVSVVEERTTADGRVIQLLSDGTKRIKQ